MHLPAKNEVHLWRIRLADVDPYSVARVLSADEHNRAAKYRFDQPRREFITSRGVLRHVLAAYLKRAPSELRLRYNQHGKPGVDGIEFNTSHAEGRALIAVSHSPVGVDLERIDPDFAWEGVAAAFFSVPERDGIAAARLPNQAAAFFRCWTRREACLKARGSGFGGYEPGTVPEDASSYSGWFLRSFEPFCGYIGAVASEISFELTTCDWKHKLVETGPLAS